jgi:hypothetical protein
MHGIELDVDPAGIPTGDVADVPTRLLDET